MAIVGRGRILVWDGASLWIFSVEREEDETDFHSHHAIQTTFSLSGDFQLRTREQTERGPAVAVAPNCEHQFRASGETALLFVEPESAVGRALVDCWFADQGLRTIEIGSLQPMLDRLRQAFRLGQGDGALTEIGKQIVASLAGELAEPSRDARVLAMVDYITENLEAALTLPEAASRACLSPDRASHLFVEQIGLPFRTYVLWRRVKRAVELYSEGASLTTAAHDAGFADSAHLSRTFRRMFGLPAASLRLID